MFCGLGIERTTVDPCSCAMTASWPTGRDDGTAGYWFHAKRLRERVHPSVPLYFLDLAEDA
jgi:hypothetical protein